MHANLTHPGISRRTALQAGAVGLLGLGMGDLAALRAASSNKGKAKACIYIFLSGGLAQHDSFDPKPDAPDGIRGEFKPIATRTPGVRIVEHLPMLAARSNRWSMVRSLTHKTNGHSDGHLFMLTGRSTLPPGFSANKPGAGDWPAIASVVKAVVARVEGYRKRFTLVTSALALSGLQMVELFCARFRQEDAFRDLKQRLGWEECRAWTRNPIERTTQAVLVTMTALRLLQRELQEERGDDWWLHPPWNPGKTRPSVLDMERLLREHREELRQGLANWLDHEGNTGG